MTDFLYRLAARALGAAPVAQPILPTIFEPNPGLERVDSPAETPARDLEHPRESNKLLSPANLRLATLPEPGQQAIPAGLRPGDSTFSRLSDPVIPKVSELAIEAEPPHVVGVSGSEVVATTKTSLHGIKPPLDGIEPHWVGIESSPLPAEPVATRRAEPRYAAPSRSISPRHEPQAESRSVSVLERLPADRQFAAPLIETQQPANALSTVSARESPPGLTHHNSETGSYGKFHIVSKPRLLPFSFATFR